MLLQLNMKDERGEVVIYQADDGSSSLEVRLYDDSIWMSLNQIAALFDRNKSVISRHLHNIFKSGELRRSSVVAKNATTAADGKTYQVDYFNLDAIISVGYRVNSIRGTHFRIWATSVLKDHLIQGYTFNERRLAEKGLLEMEQAISLLSKTLRSRGLIEDQGKAVLSVITQYAKSWRLLLHYDEDRLALPKKKTLVKLVLSYQQARCLPVIKIIASTITEATYCGSLSRASSAVCRLQVSCCLMAITIARRVPTMTASSRARVSPV